MAYVNVQEVGNLEKSLIIFDREVAKEGILKRWRSHQYFQKPSERRRAKERKSRKRLQRQLVRRRRFENPNWKPGIALGRRQKPAHESPIARFIRKDESIATVLMIIMRTRKIHDEKVIELLTLEDKEKHGRIGFPTGGIERGETVHVAACREVREETGLIITISADHPPFYEKNVSRSNDNPYMMHGIVVKKYSGNLKEGEEIVSGTAKWRSLEKIDILIMRERIVPNHVDFFNVFRGQLAEEGGV